MEEKKKTAWWRYVVSVPIYVVLSVFGGAIILILNAFMPYGGRYQEGDLGYSILQVATGPVGVILASTAVAKIMDNDKSIFLVVLNVIAATVFFIMVAFLLITGGQFNRNTLTVILAGVAAVGCAVAAANAIRGAGDGQNP